MNVSIEPYKPRAIRFLELWAVDGWRLKVYGISTGVARPAPELTAAAKRVAEDYLRAKPTRHAHYGVGFLGVHDGHGENQVFLDRWVNENELLHAVWISSKDEPALLRVPGADHNSVCVWDLAVQCRERQAWIKSVLTNPDGPDFDAYLDDRFNGDV
jgi:hypothetical protein